MEINVIAHSTDKRVGWGNLTQQFIRHLIMAGVSVHPIHQAMLKWEGWLQAAAGVDFSRLTLTFTPPEHLTAVPGRQWLYTMHEASTIPAGWSEKINATCQRVLVPSAWCKEAFAAGGVTVSIDVVPGGTEPSAFPLLPAKDSPTFTFMALGDRGARKGWDLVYRAFYEEFKDEEDVRLIIKARPGNLPPITVADPRISIWLYDADSLRDALMFADCFVLPHRSEGWGMTPREAAMMGLPAIVTAYSGTADVEHWGIPLTRFQEVPAVIEGGGCWAQPEVAEIREQMRWVYTQPEDAKKKAIQGRVWLASNQTYRQAVDILKQLLEAG